MNSRPTVLCPIDYSDASRHALCYARVVAEHFGARLLVLSVEDPLLTEAVDLGTGIVWDPDEARQEVQQFVRVALGDRGLRSAELVVTVAVGKPASEILRVGREEGCDLVIMSTHGLTGMRRLFFGSTTERVLRETTVPVLAVPPSGDCPESVADIRRTVGRILVPVDLSPASEHQVRIARGIASALQVPFLVAHVIEPVRSPLAAKLHLPSVQIERRTRAEDALSALLASVPEHVQAEALVAWGDPAEEIAKIARDRRAGLIVVGLHGSPLLGPRMGSVTYRVLCLSAGAVVALPPREPTRGALGAPVYAEAQR